MLTYVSGNLFDSPAKVLVNTVNTVGAMGKGIALTFKQIYPEMFERYVRLCEAKQLAIGTLWLYRTPHKWVLNFPTKEHWRNPSKLDYIEVGLQKFVATYAQEKIASVAFPELGCGNGELDWKDVQPLMAKYLRSLPINVYIYLYDRTEQARSEHRNVAAMQRWLRSEPRNLPFEEFWGDLKAKVGAGLTLTKLGNGEHYKIEVARYDAEGLLLHFGERTWFQIFRDDARKVLNQMLQRWRYASKRAIFIPEESLLELWQSIRFYGFCHRRMMPDGLDVLSEYLMPILMKLDYFRKVRLSTVGAAQDSSLEDALQLYVSETVGEPKEEQLQAVSA